MTAIETSFHFIFLFFLGYFLLVELYYIAMCIIGWIEDRQRAHQHSDENYAFVLNSPFTLPVSIIVPAHNEKCWIANTVQSLLNLQYPLYEIIIVDDGSTDETFAILEKMLDLYHHTQLYTDRFQSGKILGFYGSAKDARVTVLRKQGGQKKAGAINAAVNIAKYKYICVIDADTVFERDALLKVMAHAHKDPEHVIGLGSYFGLVNGFKVLNGRVLKKNMAPAPLIGYQNLEYIRSFIGNRIAWSRMNAMPIISGCFAIWRRDFVLELGGFAIEYSSEDLEFTLRAHDYLHKHPEKQYRILMLPYYVGWTEGPSTVSGLILQRNRWHRVTLEGVCLYAHMILNPKYGFLGLVTMPYFVLYEALGVFFEAASWILTIAGYFMGILNVPFFLGLLVFTMLFHALMSMMALLTYSRDQFHFKIRDILWLMVLSLLEFPLYRPLVAWARLQGTFHFLRGIRHFDRVPRSGA